MKAGKVQFSSEEATSLLHISLKNDHHERITLIKKIANHKICEVRDKVRNNAKTKGITPSNTASDVKNMEI